MYETLEHWKQYKQEKEKCLLNRIIINETVDTIIDSIYEKTEHYMFETGRYTETNDEFFKDQVEYVNEVIKELNNRIKNK